MAESETSAVPETWGDLSLDFHYSEDPSIQLQAQSSLKAAAVRNSISIDAADAAVRLFQSQRTLLDGKIDKLVDLQKQMKFAERDLEEKKTQLSFHEGQIKESRIALAREKELWTAKKRTEKSAKTSQIDVTKTGSDEVETLKTKLRKMKEDGKEKESRSKLIAEKAARDLALANQEKSDLKQKCEELQREIAKLKTPKQRKVKKTQETQTDLERNQVSKQSLRSEKCDQSFLHHEETAGTIVETSQGTDGKVQKRFADDHVEVEYPNGTHRVIYPNGYSCVLLANKDVRQTFADGRSVYFYAETRTVHWVHPDGSQVIKFANGQVEKHYPDGSSKIKYADGTVKRRSAEGEEECQYADGVLQKTDSLGNKVVTFPGGKVLELAKDAKAVE